ncbi:MAG: hypothetical protein CVU90_00215 [Firmicutes bacterium HGW-Firmicutes-15]|nr:MAG: hypothetical protein CVU90_00215 [Firmicutes bacterium HGW-Firmicutes-15]
MEEELENKQPQKSMLDPYKMWKKLYFSAEETLSSAVRKSVNTGEFANGIDFILNSYLQYLKMQNDYLSSYMKDSPFASKHDVARVAELVVSLENKLDSLEGDFGEKLTDVDNNTNLIAEQLAKQQEPTAKALSTALSPTMTALKDISHRVSDLEILINKLDAKLTDVNQLPNLDAKKKKTASPVSKVQKPTPKTKPTE